ncbi:hypothetical protein [Treponema primitia]|uniref:hypothetical protein n=1 Tax=Treponema primitia TaxID=88058 RepID=UPI000255543B|nr:hypothetical protein [Treponema primitia]
MGSFSPQGNALKHSLIVQAPVGAVEPRCGIFWNSLLEETYWAPQADSTGILQWGFTAPTGVFPIRLARCLERISREG